MQSIAQDLGIKGIKSLGRDELIYRILDGQAVQNSKSGAPAVVKEENRMNRREHRRNRIHSDALSKVYTATGEKAVKVEKDAPKMPKPEPAKATENNTAQPVVEEKKSNGMGITGFVLSLVAIILFWVPVLNVVLFILGLIFSIIGIVRKPKGFAIAGLIISGVNAILTTSFYIGFFDAMSSSYYYY